MITKTNIYTGRSYKVISENKLEEICQCDWRCLSSEDKPTKNVAINDLLIEVDTGKVFYFDGNEWQPVNEDKPENKDVN